MEPLKDSKHGKTLFFFKWYTDSGFSAEDLVSDLVGFYRVFGTGPDPVRLAKPVSYEKAIQIWDAYGSPGNYKNKRFSPFHFPIQSPFRPGVPVRKSLPRWLNYITPLKDSYSGLLYNQFRNRPVNHFFDRKNRINHELYTSFSGFGTINIDDSPVDRPFVFLLNPHSPTYRW